MRMGYMTKNLLFVFDVIRYTLCALLIFILIDCSKDTSPVDPLVEYPWERSTPESVGLDRYVLATMTNLIYAGGFGQIHSLIILKENKLVYEDYFNGYSQTDIHPLYSVTKSVTSSLLGLAVDRAYINDLGVSAAAFFPEYQPAIESDPLKSQITLENLLTMSAGFDWDEDTYPYEDPLNDVYRLSRSSDWMRFIWQLPMENTPGNVFRYNSGCTMLISEILDKSIGRPVDDFAQIFLFKPLDITFWDWESGPNSVINTGWGLQMRPVDMIKLGHLYLNQGIWQSKQIIPSDWITRSTKVHMIVNGSFNYAYQWWRVSDESSMGSGLTVNDLFFAWGYGGQFIFVIPHLNMVVVSTAGNFTNSMQGYYILRDYILPAAYTE